MKFIFKQPLDWFRDNIIPPFAWDVIFLKQVLGLFQNIKSHGKLLSSFKVIPVAKEFRIKDTAHITEMKGADDLHKLETGSQ